MSVPRIGTQPPPPTLAPIDDRLASTLQDVDPSTSPTDAIVKSTSPQSPSAARRDAILLSKQILADAGESTTGDRTVRRALAVLNQGYQAAEASSPTREQLASVGDRLIGLARDGNFLSKDHADFVTMAAQAPSTQTPAKPEDPPPSWPYSAADLMPVADTSETIQLAQAPKTDTAPATEGPGNTPARVAVEARSVTRPIGTGTNVPLEARAYLVFSRKQGDGAQPSSWTGVSSKPYSEVYTGLTTGDLIFDAKNRLDAIKPQFVAGYTTGFIDQNGASNNVTVEIAKDLERNTKGTAPTSAQIYVSRRPTGGENTRFHLGGNSDGAVWSRVEQFIPVGNGNLIRGRATATYSGVAGQAMGFSATLGLNPLPNGGNFTAPGTPTLPSLDVTVASTAAATSQQPSRASKAVTVSAGVAGPGVVANAAISHNSTGPIVRVRGTLSAIVRLGPNDTGDPPTTVTANGVDPVNMPTGRFPDEADRSNTTAYMRAAETYADNGPLPKPGDAPGPDGITVGVVHTRNKGPLASVYAQGTYDTTHYTNNASPTTRFSGDVGVHLRPIEGIPVTVGVNGNVGSAGPSISAGAAVFLDKNTTVQAGARLNLSNNEVNPYAQIRIRL